jgi:alpha-galactosidase
VEAPVGSRRTGVIAEMKQGAYALLVLALAGSSTQAAQEGWLDRTLSVLDRIAAPPQQEAVIQVVRQDYETLQVNLSVIATPLTIGTKRFEHGLGTHSVGLILVYSPEPITRFTAEIGVDRNERTQGGEGSVVFSVTASGEELYESAVLRSGQEPERVDIAIDGASVIELHVGDAGDGPTCDHADWAEAAITTAGGKVLRLDELRQGLVPGTLPKYPFSFLYGDRQSNGLLDNWPSEQKTAHPDEDRTVVTTVWTDPDTGLKVHWEVTRYSDFPAADWVLHFENSGRKDTPIIADVQALNVTFQSPISQDTPYILHKTKGAPADPSDYEPSAVTLAPQRPEMMGGGGGRSSNRDFPFFKIDMSGASVIIAVGWSGQWQANLECPTASSMRVTAGLEKTHFLLHPGERVRSPSVLLLYWEGDTIESNAQFRQLIYKHYAAVRSGKKPLPTLFCNTCFTRGGGWLNECNAENQISLINAYAPLGLEALITDAGWFEGGWPMGAGNWTPRKDAYPDGMGPVAAAAQATGMLYGLWFEPERVVAGTDIDKNHPEWVLKAGDDPNQSTGLLNLGLPEAREYFFNIVKGFMDLPGFRFYRQDFNMDPLPHWRFHDAPDRQGITEMKYIEGLYAYWDRIAHTWPDSTREECSSGGRRIDIETVKRMHIHQDSDYWFDNDVDQAQIWGLSQYLPNNLFTTPINRLDDYSFHSAMATTLCLGWIADAPDFDPERGRELLERYREVRHLLIGAWYPLLPYTRDAKQWMACQYHRPELGEGMLLVFRHAESPYSALEVSLHGLEPEATYELTYDITGQKIRLPGAELMKAYTLILPDRPDSELIVYRKVGR